MSVIRQAVLLVGIDEAQLGASTREVSNCLREIAPGIRFLDIVLEEAARYGFTDILLVAGPSGVQVESVYQGRQIYDARVQVLRQSGPQSDVQQLQLAADRLAPQFLLGQGDSLFEINLRALALGIGADSVARLALRIVDKPGRTEAVVFQDGRVVRFLEPPPAIVGPTPTFGGSAVLRRDILGFTDGAISIAQDVFPRLAAQGRLEGALFNGYFLDLTQPDAFAQAQAEAPSRRQRPCAFLDRDGTINVDNGYTHKPEDLRFIAGAPQAIRMLNEAGYYVIVVTNQAGVARGLYPVEQIDIFHAAMADALADEGAHIDAFYHCPFHENAVVDQYRVANHPDRKPNPGMILRAFQDWPIRKEGSFMIGDNPSDVAAARAAGLPGYLFENGDLRDLVRRALCPS